MNLAEDGWNVVRHEEGTALILGSSVETFWGGSSLVLRGLFSSWKQPVCKKKIVVGGYIKSS